MAKKTRKQQNSSSAEAKINVQGHRIVESLPYIPDASVIPPGYIRSQKQLEQGGAEEWGVKQQREFSIENKLQ